MPGPSCCSTGPSVTPRTGRLQRERDECGALDFDRTELKPIVDDNGVSELRTERSNDARLLIENFMVAANGAVARFLDGRGFPSVRRVVREPERWPHERVPAKGCAGRTERAYDAADPEAGSLV